MKCQLIATCLALLANVIIIEAAADTSGLCAGPMCSGNGILVQTVSGYECVCSALYTGPLCDQTTSNAVCSAPLCSGNGELTQSPSGYQCSCSAGFTGELCDQLSCQNGGTPTSNGTCTCAANFYGPSCGKSCPTDFELLTDADGLPVGCYYFNLNLFNYTDASSACIAKESNSYLAVVDDSARATAIKNRLTKLNSTEQHNCGGEFYTSGQRKDPTNSNCTAGEAVYNFWWKPANRDQIQINEGTSFSDWPSNQTEWGNNWNPNCGGNTQSCIMLWNSVNWKWDDNYCDQTHCSVCQFDL